MFLGFPDQSDLVLKGIPMAWKKPKIVETPLGAEINAYACADLKK